jgi:hypothetical protein
MSEKILNIASGKIPPLNPQNPAFIVNVDTMFYQNDDPAEVEISMQDWAGDGPMQYNIKSDVFEFMERTVLHFDRVCIYRYLEHVSFTQVLYFIYLVSTVTKPGSTVDVIVPNYEILARLILSDSPYDKNFEAQNIRLTTELLNEPSCPHASIWTPERAEYFWNLEGRFHVKIISERFAFDDRDLYLKFTALRL